MTFDERLQAVTEIGFTNRQARFLVTVMLHGGLCVPRQYAAFVGTAYGRRVSRFFDRLVTDRWAAVSDCLHNRAELYHLKHRALYQAIGQPHSRYRRPVAARHVLGRLIRLDAIVLFPEVRPLATEQDKVAFFAASVPSLPRERLPHLTIGVGSLPRVPLFPDDQPIGVTSGGRITFTYVVATGDHEPFRAFVQRHAPLLQALPEWTVRLLVPRQFAVGIPAFEAAARSELAAPVEAETLSRLRWHFDQRRATPDPRRLSFEDPDFWQDQHAFGAARFQQAYRRWLTDGDSVLDALGSPATSEALERGAGRIESQVLTWSYRHLSPVEKRTSSGLKGVEKGEHAPAQPQPPSRANAHETDSEILAG
jgi:hypothetical protein